MAVPIPAAAASATTPPATSTRRLGRLRTAATGFGSGSVCGSASAGGSASACGSGSAVAPEPTDSTSAALTEVVGAASAAGSASVLGCASASSAASASVLGSASASSAASASSDEASASSAASLEVLPLRTRPPFGVRPPLRAPQLPLRARPPLRAPQLPLRARPPLRTLRSPRARVPAVARLRPGRPEVRPRPAATGCRRSVHSELAPRPPGRTQQPDARHPRPRHRNPARAGRPVRTRPVVEVQRRAAADPRSLRLVAPPVRDGKPPQKQPRDRPRDPSPGQACPSQQCRARPHLQPMSRPWGGARSASLAKSSFAVVRRGCLTRTGRGAGRVQSTEAGERDMPPADRLIRRSARRCVAHSSGCADRVGEQLAARGHHRAPLGAEIRDRRPDGASPATDWPDQLVVTWAAPRVCVCAVVALSGRRQRPASTTTTIPPICSSLRSPESPTAGTKDNLISSNRNGSSVLHAAHQTVPPSAILRLSG